MTADTKEYNLRNELLPHIADHFAQVKPDAIYAEYPIPGEDAYLSITFQKFANVINGLAGWLLTQLGPGNGEALAYLGPNDVRYPALVLAAIKAGYVMFLPSPRNSIAAQQSLLNRLNCTTFIAPEPRPGPVNDILEVCPINVLKVPSVDELVNTPHPHIPLLKTYAENGLERFLILHTSGTTGIPKPITWTHDVGSKAMEATTMPPPDGYDSQDRLNSNKRMYMVLPPFHAAGIGYSLFLGFPVGTSLIIPEMGSIPSASGLVEARKRIQFDMALVVPSVVLELAQNPDLLEYCSKNLTHIMYCGGDLPQAIGDTVAAKLKLVNGYGATEIGMLPVVHSKTNRDPLKDWRYLDFHPSIGVELRHVSGEEFELVVARDPGIESHQPAFATFPDKEVYHTSDLFIRHPEPAKRDLWRWCARMDDVITFLNGEKTNPVSMEQHVVAQNPEVTGALVAGAQRFQASLLVEIGGKDLSVSERAAMIEKLWPSIEQANAVAPAHARVAKTHILFTTASKPLLRSPKGSIQRASSLAQYRHELDNLYGDADKLSQSDTTQTDGPGRCNDPVVVSQYIRKCILDATGWDERKLSDTENWYNFGLDSLQTITATRVLGRGLNLPSLNPSVLYLNSTVTDLTKALLDLQQHREQSDEAQRQSLLQEREELLQDLIEQIQPPSSNPSPVKDAPQTHSVILTGSTGNLGTYLLDSLLRNPAVKQVHCFNRRENAIEVQKKNFAAYGLHLDISRVSFWTVDLTKPDFGLQPEALQHLQETTTLIIHNAWAVNFNLSLASFKPNLTGTVNLINFTTRAKHLPRFFFISSISSTMGHRTENGITPEQTITTTEPCPNGYANSKYIAEHLLTKSAQQNSLLQASFARVGQVAGAVQTPSLWNKSEWFPALVLSSLHVGALPDTLGPALNRIDWVPIDLLSEVLVDLALMRDTESVNPTAVYHPLNRHPLSWSEIRPFVADALRHTSGKSIDIVPFRQWVQRVRQDIETAGKTALAEAELEALLAKNPAAKLLEFFEKAMAQSTQDNVLDTQHTARRCKKLQDVDAIKPEWIQKWVGEWLQ